MCKTAVEVKDTPLFQCLLNALKAYESGLERDEGARNEFILDIQPIVETLVGRHLNVHRIPMVNQDRHDIISKINLLLFERTYEEIRVMRGKYKRRPGYGRDRTQPGRRTPRVVWTAIQRAIWGVMRVHIDKRLNDYPTFEPKDKDEVFGDFFTDHGKAARDMERDLDRRDVYNSAQQRINEHLNFRRRRGEAGGVVARIASIITWERYISGDALVEDR